MKSLTSKLGIFAIIVAIPFFCEFAFQPKDSWTWPTSPQNMKVLKDVKGDDLKAVMQSWTKALGVKCNFVMYPKKVRPSANGILYLMLSQKRI
ncbi:MAG: hypothetical protein IPP42_08045 [Saprospiraceae bacterium]|nr:hypothetical protein [Saprospiraceae bacterium]